MPNLHIDFDTDFSHYAEEGFSYTINDYYPCSTDPDCCRDDYCRCRTIESVSIYDRDIFKLCKALLGVKSEVVSFGDLIDLYALERLLSLNNFFDRLEPRWSGGYYGDEFDGIHLENPEQLQKLWDAYKEIKSFNDKCEWILKLEYGELTLDLKGKEWAFVTRTASEITVENHNHMKKIIYSSAGSSNEFVTAVCKQKRSKTILVDGHHRLALAEPNRLVVVLLAS